MRIRMLAAAFTVSLAALPAFAQRAQVAPPPTLVSSTLPEMPAMAAGGGEVLLDVAVDRSGAVSGMTTLRETAGYTGTLRDAVSGWRFTPSSAQEPGSSERHVLVVGVFRPPTMFGPAPGAVPENVAQPAADLPYPDKLGMPPLPPDLWNGSVVLVEIHVDASGAVSKAHVVDAVPAGAGEAGSAAVRTARGWSFRPAETGGTRVPSVVYAVVGFAEPVVAAPEKPVG